MTSGPSGSRHRPPACRPSSLQLSQHSSQSGAQKPTAHRRGRRPPPCPPRGRSSRPHRDGSPVPRRAAYRWAPLFSEDVQRLRQSSASGCSQPRHWRGDLPMTEPAYAGRPHWTQPVAASAIAASAVMPGTKRYSPPRVVTNEHCGARKNGGSPCTVILPFPVASPSMKSRSWPR